MEKTVLIIAPDFVPSTYPPALRVRFFSQHLREYGWKPVILTVKSEHYEWNIDFETEQLLPEWLEIHKTNALSAKLTRKIGIGDLGLRSLYSLWKGAVQICESKKIDLIFIPIPPYYPAVLGRLLHRKFRIPYVIDYIDPWITPGYWKLPRAQRPLKRTASHLMNSILEPFALRRVSEITSVDADYVRSVFERYDYLQTKEKISIPYGGETSDFQYLKLHPRKNPVFTREDGYFHIASVGRGGADLIPVVDAFFSALASHFRAAPSDARKVKAHFVGTDYSTGAARPWFLELAKKHGLTDSVTENPARVSYLTALQIMMDSDALFCAGSIKSHYTASKVFPYLISGKPLMAIFHKDSSVVRILKDVYPSSLIEFENEQDLAFKHDEILELVKSTVSHESKAAALPNVEKQFEPYTTSAMSESLARVFNRAISGAAPCAG